MPKTSTDRWKGVKKTTVTMETNQANEYIGGKGEVKE